MAVPHDRNGRPDPTRRWVRLSGETLRPPASSVSHALTMMRDMDTFPSFVSFPTLPDGSELQIDLLECTICGAAVSNADQHQAWHSAQDDLPAA